MRELRRDPTTGDWVIIATERMQRPMHLIRERAAEVPPDRCPFCPGNEWSTPEEVGRIERSGEWSVRAVPNKFPALRLEEPMRAQGQGPYDQVAGFGAHEVIVESPRHDVPLYRQPRQQMVDALELARTRMRDLSGDRRFEYLSWFRNEGLDAGATQPHPHAQLIALPLVPPRLQTMVQRGVSHLRLRGRNLYQDLVEHELAQGTRVLRSAGGLLAFCPWAPGTPFEVWVLPQQASPRFTDIDDTVLVEVADTLRFVLGRLDAVLEDPPYNVTLYTLPQHASDEQARGFCWHLRIQPRLNKLAGFEAGTGCTLHAAVPEESARLLRGG